MKFKSQKIVFLFLLEAVKCQVNQQLGGLTLYGCTALFDLLQGLALTDVAPLKDLGADLLKPFSTDVSIAPVPESIPQEVHLASSELDLE